MDKFDLARFCIVIVLNLLFVILLFSKKIFNKKYFNVKFISRTAIFAAISTLLYVVPYFKFNLPFFPAFLEIHFEEVPAYIAAFAYGPLSGFFVILIKTIIKLPFTSSLGVGELADFIYGCVLIIPASIIYKKYRTFKSSVIGMGIGFVLQVIISSFVTTFLILDFYMFVMGFSYESLLGMCQAINPNISSLSWPFLFYVALPFNAFKNSIIVLLTLILYKKTHKLIDKISKD